MSTGRIPRNPNSAPPLTNEGRLRSQPGRTASTRRIRGNPNSAPQLTNEGLRSQPRRTVALLFITLLCLIIGLSQTDQSATEAAPVREVLLPQITPIRSIQPIVGNAVPQPSVADRVRAAVDQANTAFRDAHARADASPLLSAATGEWLAYEQDYVAGLRERGQTEHWNLLNLEVEDLTVQDRSATVCTTEHWGYTAINADGSTISGAPRTFTERYTLVLQGTNWLVSQISYEEVGC